MKDEDIEQNYLKKIEAEPLKYITSISTLFGGILFLLYFGEIHYFPDLNLANSMHLIFAIVLFGFLVIMTLSVLLIFPAWLWSQFRDDQLKKEKEKTEKHEYIEKNYNFSFLIWFIVVQFSLFLAIVLIGKVNLTDIYQYIGLIAIVVVLSVVLYITEKYLKIKKYTFNGNILFGVATVALLSLFGFLTWIPLLLIYNNGEIDLVYGIFMGLVIILLVNTLVIFSKDTQTKIISVVVFIIILMIISKSYFMIPNAFMKAFHFGNYKISKLYLKKSSCDILKKYDLNTSYILNDTNSTFGCIVNDQKVLLNLGNTIVLQEHNQTIVLPAADVVGKSWTNQ